MSSRVRVWSETAVAVCSAIVFVATLIEPQWFELLFDEAPDGGDGSLESYIALACSALIAIVFGRMARRDWRRLGQPSPNA